MKTKALVLAVVAAAGILGIRVRESNGGVVEANATPLQDGKSGGKVAAERSDSSTIPVGRVGRWSEGMDRPSFSERYRLAQGEMFAKRRSSHRHDVPSLTSASYRGGLHGEA